MRDDCVYRSMFTPVKASGVDDPPRRFLQFGQTPGRVRPKMTGTPKKEVLQLERAGKETWMLDKEALILKDWVKAHIAMKRYMRHPTLRSSLEFKDSSNIDHQNMFNFLSRTYVREYKETYEKRFGLFLKDKSPPDHCLVQSPGTCVLFSILNLYLVRSSEFVTHLDFVKGLCDALHPFQTFTLTPPETRHVLSETEFQQLNTMLTIKNKEKREELLKEQFGRRADDAADPQASNDQGEWAKFDTLFAAFVTAYGVVHTSSTWKDGEKDLDSLNFSAAVHVLLPHFSIHTIKPSTSLGLSVETIQDLMTLDFFLKAPAIRGEFGCVLVQSDVELFDDSGNMRTADELKTAREDHIRNDVSTAAGMRHAFMYHTVSGSVRVYDSWDGTISTWGRGRNTKWNGLGKPDTWIVYAYAKK